MDADNFEAWLAKLLDKIPEGAVLVLDNASYHGRKVCFNLIFIIMKLISFLFFSVLALLIQGAVRQSSSSF